MHIVVVTGGRDFTDSPKVFRVLDEINPDIVIQGGARGADLMASSWAERRQKVCIRVPAQWDAHGKSAGPRRNQVMMEFAEDLAMPNRPLLCVAFTGGRGTAHAVACAKRLNIEVRDERGAA